MALATLCFVVFGKFIGMRDVEALLYPRLPGILLPLVRGLVSFSATILWAASAVFLRALPFLGCLNSTSLTTMMIYKFLPKYAPLHSIARGNVRRTQCAVQNVSLLTYTSYAV